MVPRAAAARLSPLLDGRAVGHVGHHIAGCGTAAHDRCQHGLVAPEHRHRGARLGQRRRDGAADAASAAGDERVPSLERHGAFPIGVTRKYPLSLKFRSFKLVGELF